MRFRIKAADRHREVAVLDIDACDEPTARELAAQRGYMVLSTSRVGFHFQALRKRRFPTAVFSIELLGLLEAGLNVVEALQTLSRKEAAGDGAWVLEEIVESLRRGEPLSRAFARFPDAFPPLYVATIRSSERTGDLKEALQRYIAYHEEVDKVRKKIVSALIYPAILAAVGTLVLAFLLLYVVPRFARVYEDMSADLPLFSSLLLIVGRWIDGHSAAVLSGGLIAMAAATYALARPSVRAKIVSRLFGISTLAERARVYQLGRLYRTIGMLLRAGIPALRALEMVNGLLPANQRPQLHHAARLVSEGQPLSSALAKAGLATAVATELMMVGEKTGRMGDLMERIARFCDEETARFIDTFTRVFEPALMAFLGVAVGLIVVLMYMPIFELAGSVQ